MTALPTSVYRKPTHTDQYLACDSHQPQSVKRGIVKCLYDWAKRLVTKPSVIAGEKKHLSSVLISNGYPSSFVQKITKARTTPRRELVAEFKSTAVLPRLLRSRFLGCHATLPPKKRLLTSEPHSFPFVFVVCLRSVEQTNHIIAKCE